jgi:hypothetical protein
MNADEPKLETRNSKIETRNSKLASWAATAGQRVSSFQFRVSNFAARIPWRIVLGGAGVLFVAIWLLEHDAGLRREVEFGQLKQQTAAQVTELRARADAALRAANEERARTIESLEARRRRLEREAEELRQRLVSLREEERARVGQVATLPASELEQRVAARLDPGNFGTRDSGLGVRDSGLGTRDSELKEQASGVGDRVSVERVPDDQRRGSDEKKETPGIRPSADGLTPGTSPVPSPESRVPSPEFVLTEEGARRVETAFLELEACRGQSAVKDGALGNCQEQVATQAAIAGEMRKSLDDLNQAIRLKDEIAARTEALQRAELRAVRGSRLGRFVRAVQYVGLGVVIGLVAR